VQSAVRLTTPGAGVAVGVGVRVGVRVAVGVGGQLPSADTLPTEMIGKVAKIKIMIPRTAATQAVPLRVLKFMLFTFPSSGKK